MLNERRRQQLKHYEGTATTLPPSSTLRINIRKAQEDLNMPPNSATREIFSVQPAEYQVTANNEQFLIFDSGVGDQE